MIEEEDNIDDISLQQAYIGSRSLVKYMIMLLIC